MADSGKWECSVCTYNNKAEAFKCEMCDTRKGTSTRYKSDVIKSREVSQFFYSKNVQFQVKKKTEEIKGLFALFSFLLKS